MQIQFHKPQGKMKIMHAVGQPPFKSVYGGFDFTPFQTLKDAGIPYSRLHDVKFPFGSNRFVDIPNIFRDFDADENDPASYDFTFTDLLICELYKYGIEPIYRLGVTIENRAVIQSYHIDPPRDYAKWARICEHIIRHYNQGWANGFHYGITYWEIWNEPETCEFPFVNEMWSGTPEQYYALYDLTAKHLKQCFGDSIKVGGYASTSFRAIYYEPDLYGMDLARQPIDRAYHVAKSRMNFFMGFMEYIRAHSSPLDFFSWHSYVDVEMTRSFARFLHKTLKEYGYGDAETHLNEWNNACEYELLGTSAASARAAAMMIAQQEEETTLACYYDAGIWYTCYAGLYDLVTQKPVSTYYAFMAFNTLYRLGTQVKCDVDGEGLYAVAATDDKGEKKAVLISNVGRDQTITCADLKGFFAYTLEKDRFLEKVALDPTAFVIKENQVILLQNFERTKE